MISEVVLNLHIKCSTSDLYRIERKMYSELGVSLISEVFVIFHWFSKSIDDTMRKCMQNRLQGIYTKKDKDFFRESGISLISEVVSNLH